MGFYQGVTILLHWHRSQISPDPDLRSARTFAQRVAFFSQKTSSGNATAVQAPESAEHSSWDPNFTATCYVGLRVPTRSRESLPGCKTINTRKIYPSNELSSSPSEETSNIYSTEEMLKSREQPHVIVSGIFVQCHGLASSSPLREEVDIELVINLPNLAIIFPFLDNAVRKSRRPPCNRVGLDVFAMLAIARLRSLAVMPPVISRIEPSSAQRCLLHADRYGTRILNDELYAETIIRE
ncbi:hypothetical protein EV360DRAFT_68374 [Lentinula raphanica]|nr:hypothetical protein EV360DRAFT_68374 [Lentinula raphanica]